MTDPVILLGTQSNGETLPVQVDGFGRLVAEGLQGPEGQPGENGQDGEPGAPGPPGGDFPLPPDPYEGALLGWLNGELSWIGSPPVPIPPGVFGPITEWDAQSGLLTVEGEIPAGVGSGVYVWQCNEDGTYFTEGWNTSVVWSDGFVPTSEQNWPGPQVRAFDGNLATFAFQNASSLAWNNPLGNNVTAIGSGVRVYPRASGGASKTFTLNNGPTTTIEANGWTTINVGSDAYFNSFTIGTGESYLAAIEVDGKILVDNDLSLNLRVNSVLGQSLLGVPSATVDFTIGKYLRVPEQRVAPWVLYGNDPTSLIDHLRSS